MLTSTLLLFRACSEKTSDNNLFIHSLVFAACQSSYAPVICNHGPKNWDRVVDGRAMSCVFFFNFYIAPYVQGNRGISYTKANIAVQCETFQTVGKTALV